MPTAANRIVEDPGEVGGAVDPAVLVDGVGDQSLGVLSKTDINKVHYSLAAGLFDRVDGLLVRFRAFAFPVNIGSDIVDDGRTDSASSIAAHSLRPWPPPATMNTLLDNITIILPVISNKLPENGY